MSTYYVPCTALGTHMGYMPDLVLTRTLRRRWYYLHITVEETKAQKQRLIDSATCQSYMGNTSDI